MYQGNQEQVNIILSFRETEAEQQRGMGVAGELKTTAAEIFQQHLYQSLQALETPERRAEASSSIKQQVSPQFKQAIEQVLNNPAEFLECKLSYDASEVKFSCTANEGKLETIMEKALEEEFQGWRFKFSLPGVTYWVVRNLFKLDKQALAVVHGQMAKRVAHNVGNDLVRRHKQNLINICQTFVPHMNELTNQFGQATTTSANTSEPTVGPKTLAV